ncbi:MAG: PfkB family carbohydrate kinase [Candidatus Omnitrophica bacterium]|jgi:sugar/nucleoside kinase (ribokinase family)|nr:PfkB family carbohydrate kinase [Candidatus Omnitrophota bacterium]
MSILVVGSVALDTIKTPYSRCEDVLGGSATFFSFSARFFSQVNLVAVVGNDFPTKYLKLFREKGINLTGLEVADGETFRWEGEYDWDFNSAKTIATHLNVFSDFDPKMPAEYKHSKYVFLANIDPEIQERVLRQVICPKLVACDTMNHWIESKKKQLTRFLKKVDILFLNDAEARQLSEENNLLKAAKAIFRFGPKRIIIKKGEHGALLFSKNSIFCVPAFLLEEVYDPTGAGDTFAGGVIGYLASNRNLNDDSLRRAIVYGNIMATFAVEDFGPWRLVSLTKPEIEKRLRVFKRLTYF